jgi:hypothetical protein
MKGFTRTMNLNRNLTKTLLAATVALGTLCASPAAFAATGSHAASTAKAHEFKIVTLANHDQSRVHMNPPEYEGGRVLTRTSGPEYDGGRFLTQTSSPEYDGGRFLTRTFGPGYDGGRFLTRTSGPSYEGGRVLTRTSGPDYNGG